MKTRIISGTILAILAVATGMAGGPVLLCTILFCTLVGMNELYRACGVTGTDGRLSRLEIAGYAGAVLYDAALFFGTEAFLLPVAAVCVLIILAVYVLSFPAFHAEQAIAAVFGFFYLAVMLGFMYLTREGTNGILIYWLIFISSWGADTAAYFAGRFLGRHKMAPVLSPKKTVEGAIGGLIGAGLLGALFSFFLAGGREIPEYAVICAAGAAISIIGDLSASAIKRDKGIKDYGNLIPGHGGILDRFDSVIFTAPIIYFLSLLLIGTV